MSRAPLSRVFARPCLPNTRSPQCLAPLDHTAYADQWRQGACARVRGGVVRSFSRPSISPVHLMCMRVRAQSSLSPIISQPNHLSLPMARRAAWRAFGRFGEDTFKMTGLLALTNSDSDAAADQADAPSPAPAPSAADALHAGNAADAPSDAPASAGAADSPASAFSEGAHSTTQV